MNKEKIASIVQQLSQQLETGANHTSLLITAQMLVAELQQTEPQLSSQEKKVSIVMPTIVNIVEERVVTTPVVESKKEVEEKPVVKPVPKLVHVEENVWNGLDLLNEIPTLAHQNRAEENTAHTGSNNSVNDKLFIYQKDRAQSLQEMPIVDLKKAIGVNDRFRYISELFRDDEVMFDRSIKTINGFNVLQEAELWIQRELKLKLSWNDENPLVKQFEQLVRRRFMK